MRTAAFPKPYLWKTSIVPRTPSPGQADVSSQAAALSVVDSEQSAQLALTPSKSSEDHSLTLTTESPSLARALAHFGKVSLRISAPDRSVSVVGWLSRDGEGRLMMRPKRMVTDVDSEPP